MSIYLCDDGNCEVEIAANSPREAAQEYVDGGDWGEEPKTFWITVYVRQENQDDEEDEEAVSVKIAVEPDEPSCLEENSHDWRKWGNIQGHGGGVRGRDVCVICGCSKEWDSWAQDRVDGEQGLNSIEYETDWMDIQDALTEWALGEEFDTLSEGLTWEVALSTERWGWWGTATVAEGCDPEWEWYRSETEAKNAAYGYADDFESM